MKAKGNGLRVVERGLLTAGLLMLMIFALAHVHRFVMSRAALRSIHGDVLRSAANMSEGEEVYEEENYSANVYQIPKANHSSSSGQSRNSGLAKSSKLSGTLAVLRIPRLNLEAPVLEGTDEFTLNRGVGRILGTARPGQSGNIGIAGHRDGFFRPLRDIRAGDPIELITISEKTVYAVERIRIVDPGDVSILRPRSEPSLTLVTCYPFYFVGPAPKRYIVEASLQEEIAQEEALTKSFSQGRRTQ